MVERIFRNFDGDVFSPDDGLAGQARIRFQAPGTVKKVFFQLVSFFQRVETLANNAVASGASADTAAGTLDLDVVLVGNFEDGLAGLSLHDHTVRAMLGVWQKMTCGINYSSISFRLRPARAAFTVWFMRRAAKASVTCDRRLVCCSMA